MIFYHKRLRLEWKVFYFVSVFYFSIFYILVLFSNLGWMIFKTIFYASKNTFYNIAFFDIYIDFFPEIITSFMLHAHLGIANPAITLYHNTELG